MSIAAKVLEILDGVIETNKTAWNDHVKPRRRLRSGVKAYIDQDFTTAFEDFMEASENSPIALFHIGCMLLKGRGTVKDYLTAVDVLKATSTRIPQAISTLARIFLYGLPGVPVDKKEAFMWLSIMAVEDREFAKASLDSLEKELSEADVLQALKEASEWQLNNPEWNSWLEGKAFEDLARDAIEKDFPK